MAPSEERLIIPISRMLQGQGGSCSAVRSCGPLAGCGAAKKRDCLSVVLLEGASERCLLTTVPQPSPSGGVLMQVLHKSAYHRSHKIAASAIASRSYGKLMRDRFFDGCMHRRRGPRGKSSRAARSVVRSCHGPKFDAHPSLSLGVPPMSAPRTNRRSFLQTTAAASAAITLPYFVPARAFGASDRVITGHIGIGPQGNSNLGKFLSLATPAAVCDVDSSRAATAAKKVEGQREYVRGLRRLSQAARTQGHRRGRHLHARPLARPADDRRLPGRQRRVLREAADADHRRRAEDGRGGPGEQSHRADRLAAAQRRPVPPGLRAGPQRAARQAARPCSSAFPGRTIPRWPVPDSEPAAELDYECWLGPAPQRPYNANRVHYNFRFFWDYSGGQMTNFGAHHLDIAQWGLGMDDSGPVSIEGTATFPDDPQAVRSDRDLPRHVHLCQRREDDRRPGAEGHSRRAARSSAKRGRSTSIAARSPATSPNCSKTAALAPDATRLYASDRSPHRTSWTASKPRSCRSATSRSATAPPPSATSATSPCAWAARSTGIPPTSRSPATPRPPRCSLGRIERRGSWGKGLI